MVENKGATINQKNKDNECFKHAITVALNHQSIKKDPQRISKIKPIIDQYEWKNINFPATIKDWKKSEQDNRQLLLIYYLYHTMLNK